MQHTKTVMIIPSRGRPLAAWRAARTAAGTASQRNTQIVVAVDGPHSQDDREAYLRITAYDPALGGTPHQHRASSAVTFNDQHRGMVATLNDIARRVVGTELTADHTCRLVSCSQVTHGGFMGDDHRIYTEGWDQTLAMAAGPAGIAYGDDLNMGHRLPTAVVMSADLVRLTDYMAPPQLGHLYVDNYWLELGRALGTIAYCPQVVIEHLHPSLGKSPDDEQYRRVNSPEQFAADGDEWKRYRASGELQAVVESIRHRMRLPTP
jgi:hypothetical protein